MFFLCTYSHTRIADYGACETAVGDEAARDSRHGTPAFSDGRSARPLLAVQPQVEIGSTEAPQLSNMAAVNLTAPR
jgi:hypothetical protein